MKPDKQTNYDEPVAYDKDGRPLYAHPPDTAKSSSGEGFVHVARAAEPIDPPMSEEAVQRHEESVKKYPNLNLSKEEYVLMEVSRHWIGIVVPLAVGGFLAVIVLAGLVLYPLLVPADKPPLATVTPLALLMLVLVAIGTYIPVWVYRSNKFYLTNESAIQDLQISLFSRQEQTVSLGSIEDVSFHQTGILQLMFDYGTVRLSTIGDEDTYTFTYVMHPKEHIATLNNAVEAFKNGRPVKSR